MLSSFDKVGVIPIVNYLQFTDILNLARLQKKFKVDPVQLGQLVVPIRILWLPHATGLFLHKVLEAL